VQNGILEKSGHTQSILIILGVCIPAILSLYFITQFGLRTIFLDEWWVVPILEPFFTGENWLPTILVQQNEHIPVFPRLLILITAHFTSFNTFYELFVGWIFLSLTVLIFWLLLCRTFPRERWLIVPIAWMTFTFNQYETMLWGFASIMWHLGIFSVIATIYFLNKIENSPKSIIIVIGLSIIASFSFMIGLLLWFIGILSLRKLKSNRKLIPIFVIFGIITFVLYFMNWDFIPALEGNEERRFAQLETAFKEPHNLAFYILIFLGNGARFLGYDLAGGELLVVTASIGLFILSIFVLMILYFRLKLDETIKSKIAPWCQIAVFGLLCAFIVGVGRLDIAVWQSLSSRYILLSTLFIEGTLVMTIVFLLHITRTTKTAQRRKFAKGGIICIFIFLSLFIAGGYIQGWVQGEAFFKQISVVGGNCLLDIDNSNDECLEILNSFDPQIVREKAKILQELCLGPFSTKFN